MSEKVYNYLGLAKKAGKLPTGAMLLELIKQKKVYLVLSIIDMGKTQEKMYAQKCFFYNIPYFNVLEHTLLNQKMGTDNLKVIGISERKIAQIVIELMNN